VREALDKIVNPLLNPIRRVVPMAGMMIQPADIDPADSIGILYLDFLDSFLR